MPQIVAVGQLTINDTNDGLSAVLSNEGMSLPADKDGVVSSYVGCSTTMFIYVGGKDDSYNWTVTADPSTGVVGSFGTGVALRTYTVTSLTANSAYVDFSATKPGVPGTPTISRRFSLSISKAGTDGAKGDTGVGTPGAEGLSSVKAYCASSTPSTTTPPPNTKGRNSLPPDNSGGLLGKYMTTTPFLNEGQRLYITDGTYNPVTDYITWSVPYWSSLKVGELSSIIDKTGTLIVSGTISSANGNFTVDSLGQVTARAITIAAADGTVILSSGGSLNKAYAAPGTLNTDVIPDIQTAKKTADDAATAAATAKKAADNAATIAVQSGVFTPLAGHTFDFTSGVDGWYSMNYTGVTQANGMLRVASGNNSDPMFCRDFAGFSGATYDKIRMRVRRVAGTGWDGQIFFNREGTDGSSLLANPNLVTGEWTVLEWDMSKPSPGNGTNWPSQTITHVRIDLGNTPQDVFEIDWIAIGSTKPVTLSGIGFTGDPNANYSGGNLLYNGDFSNGLAGWEVKYDDNGCNVTVANQLHPGVGTFDWVLNKGNGESTSTLQVNQNNTLQGHAFELWGDPIPVKAGARYCVSAYTGAHRCKIDVYGVYCDVNGVSLRAFNIGLDYNEDGVIDKHGGMYLGDYYRHQQCTTIPDGVYAIRIVLQKGPTKAAMGTDSWMMAVRAQVEEVSATATTAGPWNSPPVGRSVYADVAKANAAIQDMSADGVLTPSEKLKLITEWKQEDAVWAQVRAQASNLGVDYSQYDANHNVTSKYLVDLRPDWRDLTQNTPINRDEFNNRFMWLYEARAILQNAIAAKAATLATGVTLGADGSLNGAGGGKVTLPGLGNNSFRVFSRSNTAGNAPGIAVGVYKNGVQIVGTGYSRSYTLVAINRSDLSITTQHYDVYGAGEIEGRSAANLASDLNWYADRPGQYVLVIYTADEPANNRFNSGMPDAMYRNGASRAVFGSSSFKSWSAYVLIAISGCGENNGKEAYRGAVDGDANAFLDISFNMLGGDLVGTTASYTGATFGLNIAGQIDTNNVATYIAPNTIKNTQIGGDIFSSNWNGDTGKNGAGWYLERGTGNFYGNAVKLRGAIMSGGYLDYDWPRTWDYGSSAYEAGYYLGASGLLLGNQRNNKYFQVSWDGNVYAPGFSIENGRAYFSGTLQAGTIAADTLSSLTARIGTLRTATQGPRTEIKDNLITIFDGSNIARIELGSG